jgi:hypothetical protein
LAKTTRATPSGRASRRSKLKKPNLRKAAKLKETRWYDAAARSVGIVSRRAAEPEEEISRVVTPLGFVRAPGH